jgi:cytochrome c oxidase assembly factor CtaG
MNPKLHAFLLSWEWPALIVGGLLLAGGLYAIGTVRLRRRAGGRAAPPPWRAWCYASGLLCLVLAFLSPIAVYGSLFFFMHMIQHMLLIIFAAPLLLLGAPLPPLLWGLPRGARRTIGAVIAPRQPLARLGGLLTAPLVALFLFLGTVAAWHLPRLYDLAQGRTRAHDLEHLTFLGTALLYWWAIVHPAGGRRRLGYVLAIPYLLLSFVEGTVIGILLTFAGHPVYRTYTQVPRVWGLSVLDDQQIGGLIMWVVGGAFYLLPLLVLIAVMLQDEERRKRAQPRRVYGG